MTDKPEMTAVVALTLEDGTAGRMQIFGDSTDEAIEAAASKTFCPAVDERGRVVREPGGSIRVQRVVSWRRVESVESFPDGPFKAAWKDTGDSIEIDMPKARAIHREHLRSLRAPLLSALDVEFQRAYKDPKAQDAIEAKKQALRDVTADSAIEAAATPEQLQQIIPMALRSG